MSGYGSDSAISMAAGALQKKKAVQQYLHDDPVVRIVVVKAARSIATCREVGEEFPRLVAARSKSRLISRHETPWAICDLEDVVQSRPRHRKRRFAEVEACKFRNRKGLYGKEDTYHFRAKVAKRAEDELLKAVRRTALLRYPGGFKNGEVLMVLAAGWNADTDKYSSLDAQGKAWLRADTIATAELCALNGHPMSAIREKLNELSKRRRGSHQPFLRQSLRSIRAVRPKKRNLSMNKEPCSKTSRCADRKRRKVGN